VEKDSIMADFKVTLSVADRLTLLGVLPEEGNLGTIRLLRGLQEKVGFSADELSEIRFVTEGRRTSWQPFPDRELEFHGMEVKMIVDRLEALNKSDKLTLQHLPLCEKFLESTNGGKP
jgi:hypothetical protein